MQYNFFQSQTSVRPAAVLQLDEDLDYLDEELDWIADALGCTIYERALQ